MAASQPPASAQRLLLLLHLAAAVTPPFFWTNGLVLVTRNLQNEPIWPRKLGSRTHLAQFCPNSPLAEILKLWKPVAEKYQSGKTFEVYLRTRKVTMRLQRIKDIGAAQALVARVSELGAHAEELMS